MAKSLRSKWKRKMKAVKRVRYGERENQKLVKMIEAAEELKKVDGQDSVMVEDKIELNSTATTEKNGDEMDISVKAKYSKKSLKASKYVTQAISRK